MRRLRHLLPLAVSATLVACAPEISSPGNSNDALQEAPDGKIPPHTSRNPFDIPLSEAELQKREAIATELRQQMQTDIYNNAMAYRAANSPPSSDKSGPAAPVSNFPTAVIPTPVTTTLKPVNEAQYGGGNSPISATIAEMREYFRDHPSNYSSSRGGKNDYDATINDPQAEDVRTKYAIATVLYLRGNEPLNGWVYDDSKFNEIKNSCRWFQMALNQIKSEFPALWNMKPWDRQRFQFDPDGTIFGMQTSSSERLQGCPTDQQRSQQRAQVEAEKKEAASREEEKTRQIEEQQQGRQLASLLKKDIGDNVCDLSGNFVGQVENVNKNNNKIKVQYQNGGMPVWQPGNDFYICDPSTSLPSAD